MVRLSGHGFTEGGLSLVPLEATSSSTNADRIYKQTHGHSNTAQNKVILLFGDDTSCKTALKDAFVNYIYQTQAKDTYRFVLVDDSALENDPRIKAYVFNQTEETLLPFNLVLIDVPALGGLHSAEADIRMLSNLEHFLQAEFKSTTVSAVNLVAPSSSIFFRPFINTYNMLNLSFEKLSELAQVMVTNSPSHMPFINSLRKVRLSYNNLFTFYTENQISDEDEQFLSQIYLHYDYPGVDDFFQELKTIPPSIMSLVKKIDAGLVIPSDIARLRVVNQFSETRGRRHGISFRQLRMMLSFKDETSGVQIISMGKNNDRPNKIVVLVGDRKSGKTTIATSFANRLFGIRSQDSYRLLIDNNLVNTFEKTDGVQDSTSTTAYIFKEIPGLRTEHNNFAIIDSVGFAASKDKQYNKTVMLKITKILRHITAKSEYSLQVVFVTTGIHNKLPTSFRGVHKQLLSLVDKRLDKMMFVDAFDSSQASPVPTTLKKLESAQISIFKYDPRILKEGGANHSTDHKEVLTDINWIIEHHTLEKLFGLLQV